MHPCVHSFFLLLLLAAGCEALYGAKTDVQVVDPKGLKELLKGPKIVLLEFFAPWCGHCRNLVPEMEKAAKALNGIVTVAAVDADQHKELAGQYQVQGFPTMLLFNDNRNKPQQFNGGRTAKDIVAYCMREASKAVETRLGGKSSSGSKKSASKSNVVELTDDNFEEMVLNSNDLWMVEFYAPWCGHCKNLAPEWEQAANELKGSVKLGMVDATVHQKYSSVYGVQGYPTIKVFGASKAHPEDYQGQRSANGIVKFALEKLDSMGIGPEVNEAASKQELVENCIDKSRLCVVAVLPHVMDTGADGRNKYIETLVEAAKKVRSRHLSFMWISAGNQPAFEEAFNVQYNYPTFVAVNSKKMLYSAHKGAFSTDGIVKSLIRIESGRSQTAVIKKTDFLENFKAVDPWDGKDYVMPEEEEF